MNKSDVIRALRSLRGTVRLSAGYVVSTVDGHRVVEVKHVTRGLWAARVDSEPPVRVDTVWHLRNHLRNLLLK